LASPNELREKEYMPTVQEAGILADAVYGDAPLPPGSGWVPAAPQAAAGVFDGFQAAAFSKDGATIIAFRGTAQAIDAVVDLKLTAGMNSTYFSAGENYAQPYTHRPNVYICGHSLGGAIAQVVANRLGFKFVTFNAPGVAVFASRNIWQASPNMTAVRSIGMVASAFRHPIQAVRDVRSAFNVVHGLNICLECDVVSQIGIHYGDVVRIWGTSFNPLTEHRMTTMNAVLKGDPVGLKTLESL
jgi:putative lipase involved disintegration of autophagic bodies